MYFDVEIGFFLCIIIVYWIYLYYAEIIVYYAIRKGISNIALLYMFLRNSLSVVNDMCASNLNTQRTDIIFS